MIHIVTFGISYWLGCSKHLPYSTDCQLSLELPPISFPVNGGYRSSWSASMLCACLNYLNSMQSQIDRVLKPKFLCLILVLLIQFSYHILAIRWRHRLSSTGSLRTFSIFNGLVLEVYITAEFVFRSLAITWRFIEAISQWQHLHVMRLLACLRDVMSYAERITPNRRFSRSWKVIGRQPEEVPS